jgi:hypothetical protein
MKTLEEFFEKIKFLNKKPAFFSVYKVEDIHLIIEGYIYALAGPEAKPKKIVSFTKDFRKFVNNHFETTDKDFVWEVLIRINSNSDKESLNLFDRLFTEYLQITDLKTLETYEFSDEKIIKPATD